MKVFLVALVMVCCTYIANYCRCISQGISHWLLSLLYRVEIKHENYDNGRTRCYCGKSYFFFDALLLRSYRHFNICYNTHHPNNGGWFIYASGAFPLVPQTNINRSLNGTENKRCVIFRRIHHRRINENLRRPWHGCR